MIEKSKIKEINGLGVLEADCGNCGKSVRVQVNTVPNYAMGGSDPFCGGRCRTCGTTLWAVLRFNTVLAGFFANPGAKSLKDHNRAVECAFLESLPPCPVCGEVAHDEFVENTVPKNALDCPDCHAALPTYRDVTASEMGQDVYLFWESEEDMRKHKSMRTPRKEAGR